MSEEQKIPGVTLTPAVAIILAGIIVAVAVVFTRTPATATTPTATDQNTPTASASVPLPTADEHIIGSVTAPIVLIEYSDFQCPYCTMIHPSLKKIVADSKGEVAWVMRNYPLYQIHPEATPAANAAECIADQLGNDAWWKFADAAFANQKQLGSTYYRATAQQLGANLATYDSCVASEKFLSKIDAQTAEAQVNGGNGTPYTIVLNTKTGKQYPIPGALPYAQLVAIINAAKK